MKEESKNQGVKSLEIDREYILMIIPAAELDNLKKMQEKIIERLDQLQSGNKTPGKVPENYVTAQQYMDAVKIRRWKFDDLIANNLIKTIKKKRKIYVPESEIQRYFTDPSIQ
jgi:hypothetical protein